MDENEFRERLKKRDSETLEERVDRRNELSVCTYGGTLPQMIWIYLCTAVDMYICGYFASAILWCATTVELALEDKLIDSGKGTKEVIVLLSLVEKTRLCRRFKIITREDKRKIDELRNLRNAIAHADAGRLTNMARQYYGNVDDTILQVLPSLYLGNFAGAMKSEALKSVEFTRELTLRWYGEKPSDCCSVRA